MSNCRPRRRRGRAAIPFSVSDITLLSTGVRGAWLYLYLIVDVWSRRIVGWRIAARESTDAAADLMIRVCRDSGIDARGLVLHSDNGAAMRGRRNKM